MTTATYSQTLWGESAQLSDPQPKDGGVRLAGWFKRLRESFDIWMPIFALWIVAAVLTGSLLGASPTAVANVQVLTTRAAAAQAFRPVLTYDSQREYDFNIPAGTLGSALGQVVATARVGYFVSCADRAVLDYPTQPLKGTMRAGDALSRLLPRGARVTMPKACGLLGSVQLSKVGSQKLMLLAPCSS